MRERTRVELLLRDPLFLFLQHWAQRLVNGLGDDPRPFGVRMYAVGLIQRFDSRDAIKEKRDERDLMLLCQRLKSLLNFALVIRTRISRGIHSCQQYCHAAPLGALDNQAQVLLHLADGLPAQEIVRTELKNQKADITFQSPVYASQAARRSVA